MPRVCIDCADSLPLSAFRANSRGGYERACKTCTKDRRRVHKHGLTWADKAAIAAEQGGCALCPRTDPGEKGWVVDHDRSCCPGDRSCIDCRRGILCQWCNSALGYAGDDPARLRRMADYLESGVRINSVVEVNLATQHQNTDGEDGRTYEEPTHVSRPSYVLHARTTKATAGATK